MLQSRKTRAWARSKWFSLLWVADHEVSTVYTDKYLKIKDLQNATRVIEHATKRCHDSDDEISNNNSHFCSTCSLQCILPPKNIKRKSARPRAIADILTKNSWSVDIVPVKDTPGSNNKFFDSGFQHFKSSNVMKMLLSVIIFIGEILYFWMKRTLHRGFEI